MTKNQASINLKELETYIHEILETGDVPGLTLTIVKDGNTVVSKGYGTREVGKDLPVDEHTLFCISGTTASFNASALAILVGENKMAWHDPIINLLPGFKTGNDLVTQHTTVVDALANRTGLASQMLSFLPHPQLDRADILAQIKYLDSSNTFRTHWGMNFHMHVAAGQIIPALTDVSWDDFVHERLFKPIDMTDSVTGPHLLSNSQNVATPHETESGKITPVPHGQTTNIGPATSIYSSAADMAKWLKFQLNNGKVGEQIIIPETEVNMMRTGYIPCNFSFPGISKHFINQGLGLFISDSSMGYQMYSAGGDSAGMESYHVFVPELNLGIAVMTNSTKVIPQPLIAWIIDRYTDAPYRDWIPAFAFDDEAELSKLEECRIAISDPDKRTSHSIEAYAGVYQHPLNGDLELTAESGELLFTLGTSYKGQFLHANYDTFYVKTQSPRLGKILFNGPAQFRLDKTGKISSVFVVGCEFQKV